MLNQEKTNDKPTALFCFESTSATGLYLFLHHFQFTVSKASLPHCEYKRSTLKC